MIKFIIVRIFVYNGKSGLLTLLIPRVLKALLIKKVFPAPRFPFNIITSPGITDLIKFSAIAAVSISLPDFITEG